MATFSELFLQQYSAARGEERPALQASIYAIIEPKLPGISESIPHSTGSDLQAGPSSPGDQSQHHSNLARLPDFSEYAALNYVLSTITEQGTNSNSTYRLRSVHSESYSHRSPSFGPRRPHTNSPLFRLYRKLKGQHKKKGSEKSTFPSKKAFRSLFVRSILWRAYRFFRQLVYRECISESAKSIICIRSRDLEGLKALIKSSLAVPSDRTADDWGLLHVSSGSFSNCIHAHSLI